MLIYLFTILFSMGADSPEQIQKNQAQDRLIDKLTQVSVNLAPSDSSKTSIALRLADLHSERGRRLAMSELNTGCVVCKAGSKDRQKAVQLYTEVLPKLESEQKARVMIQVGHLSEMLGQETKAIEIYQTLVKDKDPKIAADAELSLAEVQFKKRNYRQAAEAYQRVKTSSASTQKGLAMYRLGWCYFNMDQPENGAAELKKVLQTPELITRGTNGAGVDKQFQEEVSRDMATMISRTKFQASHIEELYNLSPDNARLAHSSYLASEYERLGNIPAAIAAWRFVIQRQPQPQARLEGHVHLAQLQAAHQNRKEAISDYETSLSLWTQLGNCNDETCKQLRIRLKSFLVDWNTLEKKSPSTELLEGYKKYLEVFPNEPDVRIWQAQVAAQLKQYEFATNEYLRAAGELSAEAKANPKMEKARKDLLENSLLAAIENAEAAKKPELDDKATAAYLAMSLDRKKEIEVQYQRNQMVYEAGKTAEAADAMKAMALNKRAPADIREKSANLALDALVLLKDDVKLEAWAKELGAALPGQAKEFNAVARKSVLTQSSAQASATGGEAAAWATLLRFDVNGASQDEKTNYLKNKLILAEKLKKYPEARDAADQLLRQPGLKPEDQQFALSRKAWLAELQFDFVTALNATEKLQLADLDPATRSLKLALLAELADKDSKPFYRNYIQQSKDKEKTVAVAVQLVKTSPDQLKEFNNYKTVIAQNPEYYTELAYEIYAKTGKKDLLAVATAKPEFASTPYGKAASRTLMLDQYAPMKDKLAKHNIDSANQGKLAKSLKARVALLEEAEKLATKAVDQQEWASQILFLNLVANERERFYNEVLALPVPAGLSPEEEQQYLGLLSQQAAPHQVKANDIKGKLKEIYANKEAFTKFHQAVAESKEPIRKELVAQMTLVRSALPAENAGLLADVSAPVEAPKPSLAQVEQARQQVRETPFDSQKISELMKLEKQLGRNSMVSYLQTRLDGLGSEASKKN